MTGNFKPPIYKAPPMLERDVKKQCLAYLHARGIYAYNQRNTGTWNPKAARFIPAPLKGIPDIVGYFGPNHEGFTGHAVYVETKREKGGTVSPHQEYFITEAKRAGCFACIVHSVDELQAELAKYLGGPR